MRAIKETGGRLSLKATGRISLSDAGLSINGVDLLTALKEQFEMGPYGVFDHCEWTGTLCLSIEQLDEPLIILDDLTEDPAHEAV